MNAEWPWTPTDYLRSEHRQFILERDFRVCSYCGGDADEVDHIVPPCDGMVGPHEPGNLAAACSPCNRSKNASTPWQWICRSPRLLPPVLDDALGPGWSGARQLTTGMLLVMTVINHERELELLNEMRRRGQLVEGMAQ